jgi:hypothetical protein
MWRTTLYFTGFYFQKKMQRLAELRYPFVIYYGWYLLSSALIMRWWIEMIIIATELSISSYNPPINLFPFKKYPSKFKIYPWELRSMLKLYIFIVLLYIFIVLIKHRKQYAGAGQAHFFLKKRHLGIIKTGLKEHHSMCSKTN